MTRRRRRLGYQLSAWIDRGQGIGCFDGSGFYLALGWGLSDLDGVGHAFAYGGLSFHGRGLGVPE